MVVKGKREKLQFARLSGIQQQELKIAE